MSAVSTVLPITRAPAIHGVMRALVAVLPESRPAEREVPLELSTPSTQPTRLISAQVIEGESLRARRVPGDPVVGLSAFLDGTQKSEIAGYIRGVPVIWGTVATVIRDRRDRRMHTWQQVVEHRLYASRGQLSPLEWERLGQAGYPLADSSEGDGDASASEHPLALREAVVHRVQKDRERAEHALAFAWCQREDRRLMVDGGIGASEALARSNAAIGVVKSHRTLYVSGPALATVLALAEGERSSVFLVTSRKRADVASWYLRIRDPRGRDPMWGLVRVEVAPATSGDALTQRADEVSRWILAEVAPVSLPDGRWHTMLYGVRDCEEFLRAIT
jgi:hypothetical protein